MSKKPKVSVIMGVLNAEKRLEESIKSIQNQTFEDWEFIICDDGSTDGTIDLLKSIAHYDNRIILLKNKKNIGLASTLNRCIDASRGEYIARMDDDDFSYPDRLKIQFDFLNNNREYDFVSSAIDSYNGEIVVANKEVRCIIPQKEDFLWGNCFVHPATMFRASKLKDVGGYRVAKETRRAEDYDLFMRMYARGMKGYNIQKPLLRYYINPVAMKKRKYKYRIDEMIVRYKGFKALNLFPRGIIYIFKPLIVGLIPNSILFDIRNKYGK